MERNLLIHSMATYASLTLPILEAVNATTIAEIGAEHGGHSKLLYEWLKARNGKLISIDCNPSQSFVDWVTTAKDVIDYMPYPSLTALSQVGTADAWFIDGDHNWYTVYHELKAIREKSRSQNRPLLIFLHDVSWPWGRRDLYYSPSSIPENFCHPHTWDKGVTLDNPGVIEGGFRGMGQFAAALKEGGPRNGVLTAVEDFLKEHKGEFCFAHIPAVFGLGVLFDFAHPQAEQIATIVSPFHNNTLLQEMEISRLLNYLKVLEWQDRDASANNNQVAVEDDVVNLEKKAVELINLLDEKRDSLDLWKTISGQLPARGDQLTQFIDYLSLLLAVPQDENALKLIHLLEAICIAKNGDLKSAHAKLEKLYSAYTNCSLITSAYAMTFGLAEVVE